MQAGLRVRCGGGGGALRAVRAGLPLQDVSRHSSRIREWLLVSPRSILVTSGN